MSEKIEAQSTDEAAEDRDEPQASVGAEGSDTEGHSMFLYEAARNLSRQHEHDAKQAAREARLLKESKEPKGR